MPATYSRRLPSPHEGVVVASPALSLGATDLAAVKFVELCVHQGRLSSGRYIAIVYRAKLDGHPAKITGSGEDMSP